MSTIWQTYSAPLTEPADEEAPVRVVATRLRRNLNTGTVQGRIEVVLDGAMPPLLTQSGVDLSDDAARQALLAACRTKRDFTPSQERTIDQAMIAIETRVNRDLDEHEHAQQERDELYPVEQGRLCVRRGAGLVPLANFVATIVAEHVRDDGADQRREVVIEGRLAGGAPLPAIQVPLTGFRDMGWVSSQWGTRAVIAAGVANRDMLREAMQLRSPAPPLTVTYAHTGWRRLPSGDWVYLHAGGAVGTDGTVRDISVDLPGALAHLLLPDPPSGDTLAQAMRASLDLFHVGPAPVMAVVLGIAYRAPLCEIAPADVSAFLVGRSGVFKTELTVLAIAHFGEFTRLGLPASWMDTANTLERTAFELKDAPMVVDDFIPTGTAQDQAKLYALADRLLRGIGNRAARGRMTSDGRRRPSNPPRGIAISSGEDTPRGHSLIARLLVATVGEGDVDMQRLTAAQEVAAQGTYRAAMAGYLQWLAPRLDDLRQPVQDRLVILRSEAQHEGTHSRTPDAIASMLLGWELWLRFAVEIGAVAQPDADARRATGFAALHTLAGVQTRRTAAEAPAQRFIELVRAAISSGRAHLAGISGDEPDNPGAWGRRPRTHHDSSGEEHVTWHPADEKQRIGYVDGDSVYLLPESAYTAVQQLAQAQQGTLFVQQRTLWRRLYEAGLLTTREAGRERYTVRKTVAGMRVELLHVQACTLLGTDPPSQPSQPTQRDMPPEGDAAESPENSGTVGKLWDGYGSRPSQQNGHLAPHPPLVGAGSGPVGTVGTAKIDSRGTSTLHDEEPF